MLTFTYKRQRAAIRFATSTTLTQRWLAVLAIAFASGTAILKPVEAQELTQAKLDEQLAIWQSGENEHYQYSFQRFCFCFGDFIRPAVLEVQNGDVVSALDAEFLVPLDTELFPTIDELFAQLQTAIDHPAETIDAEFSSNLGYPTSVFIDLDLFIADEEIAYRADSFTTEITPDECDEACQTVRSINAVIGNFGFFNPQYDLNSDSMIDIADLELFLNERKIPFGDANGDGSFDSSDLVEVFVAGEFEDREIGNSTWGTGDWNGDRDFDTTDLVFAFQQGAYESDAAASVAAVPEPEDFGIGYVVALLIVSLRRRTA